MDEPKDRENADSRPPSEPCRFLRTKTMYYDFNREAALSIGPPCDTASYRCVKTSRVVGPDGEPVQPSECVPARTCYEA
jgi:hypothetical protein